jgi:hypothetical protein
LDSPLKQDSKESGPKDQALGCPLRGLSMVFPLLRQSAGMMEWWSIVKYQIPSTKLQTNLKFQYSMTKTGLEF